MTTMPSSGEWREERLYVLQTLEDLKVWQLHQIESDAIMHQTTAVKAEKDIKAAHDKIRNLENAQGILTLKNWVLAGMLSTGGVAVFELIKWALHK